MEPQCHQGYHPWWWLPSLMLLILGANAMSIEYVQGQRCLFTPARKLSDNPPIVIIGGMAQTIASWEHHVPALSQDRPVLLYEARGQGPPRMTNTPLEDQFRDVSLPAQADYLIQTLEQVFPEQRPVDLVGFSLGGRIAMATCLQCHATEKKKDWIRKVHLTGVAADRSDFGHLTVASWKDHVAGNDNLRSFAWSVLLATYSSDTLKRWHDRVKLSDMLQAVATQNSRPGLAALLEQTHSTVQQRGDDWSPRGMASQLAEASISGGACVGSLDCDMAPVAQVAELCRLLNWDPPVILEGCGHAAPMEQPRQWRNAVLEFLNQ